MKYGQLQKKHFHSLSEKYTVADYNNKISFSKMVELLNEKAIERAKSSPMFIDVSDVNTGNLIK